MKRYIVCVVVGFFSFVLSLAAQTPSTGLTSAQVPPPLIQFSNVATDEGGNTMSGVVNISFSLYNSQQGGEPLWTETQNSIPLDPTGHYSVQLGITKPSGVPTTLFTTGEARWLGVQIAEQAEQPRVLLVSVPYALKAGDAETVGGLPPSAFVLAAPQNGAASAYTTASAARQSVSPATATDVTTTGGKANYLPVFNGASTIVDSLASQSGGAINLPKLALQNTNAGGTQGVIEFGGVPFIHNYGPPGSYNSFFGRLAGNLTNSGLYLTAVGDYALTTDTSGSYNTSLGYNAGATNTTGSNNTFLGYQANPGSNNLTNATALGANAEVTESNALILGSTSTSVGIGITAPGYSLHVLQQTDANAAIGATGLSVDGGDFSGDGIDAYGGGFGANGGSGVLGSGGGTVDETDGSGGVFRGGCCGGGLFGDGVDGYAGSGYAGNFYGNVNTTGSYLVNGVADMEIDHPLDPANKYLVHSSVESSEMMNIYTGNVVLDSTGAAAIQLPEWFSALNRDFRYQLTSIGAPSPNLHVAEEIAENRFKIAGGHPGAKVSWQVTGARQDAYAKAHPLVVEQEKEPRLRGFYTHPEFYGAPPEKQIEWARHPHMMKRIKEMQTEQRMTIRAAAQPAIAEPK
jgi:hypothetical protein